MNKKHTPESVDQAYKAIIASDDNPDREVIIKTTLTHLITTAEARGAEQEREKGNTC